MGVVLNLLGSDVMHVKRAVTVSGLCKSNNGSIFKKIKFCSVYINVLCEWRALFLPLNPSDVCVVRQKFVHSTGVHTVVYPGFACIISHILFQEITY